MAYADLTTVEEVKAWLKIPPTDKQDDGILASLIAAASESIGRLCGRDNLGEVISYTENYFLPSGMGFGYTKSPRVVLGNYPVITLSAVTIGTTSLPIITNPASQTYGALLLWDMRTVALWNVSWLPENGIVRATYTAGYATADIPPALRQACCQYVGEIYKAKDWIGFQSKSLAGETVSFDLGRMDGMSQRTRALVNPFIDVVPSAVM